jgi:tripartite ATP-independent transporter DctM subunit
MVIGILLCILLVLIFLGFPVLLAIAVATLWGIINDPSLVLAMFTMKTFATLDSFALLAMPYFILAGALMSRGGISAQLVDFSDTLVGHMRAGLAKTNVITAMIFAGVSGSSTADTAAVGSVLIPTMKQRGYPAGLAAAITACAGTMGPIIPPSLTFVIYGSMTGISIAGLFVAGILPGILVGVGMIACLQLMSYSARHPEMRAQQARATWKATFIAAGKVWAALIMPVIIVGGILSGVFTATESGVVASIYAAIVSVWINGAIKIRELPAVLLDAGIISAAILGILAVAGAFGWLLAYYNFSASVTSHITDISSNGYVVLALLLGLMLFLTMFIESLAVLVVLVPVAMAVQSTFGFDPLHVGVLMVVATQIGAVTPPVAVLLFVSTGIAGTPFENTVRYVWPFLGVLLLILAILFTFPFFSTLIPHYIFTTG